ncbi:hypothetical protein CampHawk_186 [Bacillus phage CampHawk]|uniref:Uncharacterized protein n=1 Tax=Bacillus phage CampHawk TaxID=1406783 RepID=U5PT76_9CAUD|nr:hypothetical protein CampHawk_186 [Bacillus phage CampHawk]AGY47064.1 hypothetical protein CampHawk_186 [Bacillus phage CampHawk]
MKRLEEIKQKLSYRESTSATGEGQVPFLTKFLTKSDIEFLVVHASTAIQIYENLYNLGWSMQDAPFFGMNKDARNGVDFAIEKILQGTGVSMESIIEQKSVEDQNERIRRAFKGEEDEEYGE